MNEKEFFQFAKNKIFLYQSGFNIQGKKDGPINCWVRVFLDGSESQNFLTVIFNADHTLTYPAKLGFLPPERKWQFDEGKQEINLFDESGANLVSAYSLPTSFDEGHFVLSKINAPDKRYLAFTTFDIFKKKQNEPTFASQRVVFLCDGQSVMTEQEINHYTVEHCCEINTITNDEVDTWDLVNQVWDRITQDEKLKDLCVFLEGKPDLDKSAFSKKLVIKTTNKHQQYIAGPRSDMIIVLSQLLTLHYRERLAESAELHTPVQLLSQVITN
ncbi:hypothetical protein PT287_09895 [Lactobacillus sp. ESL0679]|uniref:hypothetical protein n=1 Tax=Lactobacillus sp. ESL0679 TaxID=2983209 RepID=UPI0023F8462E|nr:hypothetical protein [Lactobacillus sp. ESL0679]MDF7683810.1 hypothetical protein [Lactobacillus sp. ESL0679]